MPEPLLSLDNVTAGYGDAVVLNGVSLEIARGGRCVAEFDVEAIGIRAGWVRLETASDVGPWFRWATVGVDSAASLAAQVGLTLRNVSLVGGRVIATLVAG